MTKSKAYYQAYLVIGCLSKAEYNLIPKELLEEIKSKMEVDESIKVDKTIPLEKQKIDEKTYDILDRVISSIEKAYGKDAIDNPGKYQEEAKKKNDNEKVFEFEIGETQPIVKNEKEKALGQGPLNTYNEKELKEENLKLKGIINALEAENKKIEEAKELYYDYKEIVAKKDNLIDELKTENESLKKSQEELKTMLDRIPKLVRKIFKIDNILK